MGTILIKNGTVITLNDKEEIYYRGFVFIENDLIVEVESG